MLLWGVFSWANLISGLVVAAVVLRRLPAAAGRPSPAGSGPSRCCASLARFAADLVRGQRAARRLAFRFGHQPRSAIIRVPLRVRSDLTSR